MSPKVHAQRRRLALRLVGGALAWSLGLLLTALLAPVDGGQTVSDANGLTLTTATYVQRNGDWVLLGLALPLAVSLAVGVIVTRRSDRRLRRATGGAVGILTLLGLVLVTAGGVLLLPVAILLGAALALTRVPPRAHPASEPGSAPGPATGANPGQASTGSRG